MIFRLVAITCLVTALTPTINEAKNFLAYENVRNQVLQAEESLSTGGQLKLNARESQANAIFLKHKSEELERGFHDPEQNAAGMHFFEAKPLIEMSKVFKFLQKMPKGALLHVHTTAAVSSEWVVKNIFYEPGLLRCVTEEGLHKFSFRELPEKHRCATQYVNVNEERLKYGPNYDFDGALDALINLCTNMPETEYSSINKVWTKFQNIFSTLSDVLSYRPVYRSFHRQILQELYDDNVMYAELRLGFHELYDVDGSTIPQLEAAKEIIDVVEQFKKDHPKFLGVKMIYSVNRRAKSNVIFQRFETFKKLYSKYPSYIIGFDLVGQEDKGEPLHDFIRILTEKPQNAKYFFHAGETNWYGTSTDNNLLDAILLNTTRIGHGYALIKHPVLWNAVKKRDLAIEVSPISNQVLELVRDLRNHPASFYFSENIPIVICNDDPGFWSAKGLSYDFYYAIMSFAPYNAGLKTLKQLALNSIKYSTWLPQERKKAYTLWKSQWDSFIDDVINGNVV